MLIAFDNTTTLFIDDGNNDLVITNSIAAAIDLVYNKSNINATAIAIPVAFATAITLTIANYYCYCYCYS